MTSKEFLNKPYEIKKKIRYLELELDNYRIMMNSIPQPSYGTVRVDKSPSSETPNQKALEKYYETETKLNEKKLELEKVIDEIMIVIDELENEDLKLLLKFRYINSLSFAEIQDKLFVSYSTIKRWHIEALGLIKVPNGNEE